MKSKHGAFFFFIVSLGFASLFIFQNCGKVSFTSRRAPEGPNGFPNPPPSPTPNPNIDITVIIKNGSGDIIPSGSDTCTAFSSAKDESTLVFKLNTNLPVFKYYLQRLSPDIDMSGEVLSELSPVNPISVGQDPGVYVFNAPNTGSVTFENVSYGTYRLRFYGDVYVTNEIIEGTNHIDIEVTVRDCSLPPPTPSPGPSPVPSPGPSPAPSPGPSPSPSQPGSFTIQGVRGFTTGDIHDQLIFNPSSGEEGAWTQSTGATSYSFRVLNLNNTQRCVGASYSLLADIDSVCGTLPDGTYKLEVTAQKTGSSRMASNSPYIFYVKTPKITALLALRSDLTWLPPQSTQNLTIRASITNPSPYVATDIDLDSSNHRDHLHKATSFRKFTGVIPKAPNSTITNATPYMSEPLFQWAHNITDPIGCGTQGYVFAKYFSSNVLTFASQGYSVVAGEGFDLIQGNGPCVDTKRPVASLTSNSAGVLSGTGSDADLPTTPTAIGVYLQYNGTDSTGWGGGHLLNWYRTGNGVGSYGTWVANLKQINSISDVGQPNNDFVTWYNNQSPAVRNELLPICNGKNKLLKLWIANIPKDGRGASPYPRNVQFKTLTINCN